MIEQNDLKAAVSSGLLTEKQAATLLSFAHSRKGARENLAVGDEPVSYTHLTLPTKRKV